MTKLTKKQIQELPWAPGEKYSLVSRRTKTMHYSADSKSYLEGILRDMKAGGHPLAEQLQLVSKDGD